MNKTQTTMLTIGLLVVVAFCAFMGGMHVGGKETSAASECILPAPVQSDSDVAEATPGHVHMAEGTPVSLQDLDWRLNLAQPIRQFEEVLDRASAQQSMNYTSANLALVYDAKLYLAFHHYLRGLAPERRGEALVEQRIWLARRDEMRSLAYGKYEGGSMASLVGSGAFISATKRRLAYLERAQGEAYITARQGAPRKLVTDYYEVTITHLCDTEGCVECDNMQYHGVSRLSGNAITLMGSTLSSHSPDGTPTRFRGYEFRNGNTTYRVLDEGWLVVTQGDKTLIMEDGTWQ